MHLHVPGTIQLAPYLSTRRYGHSSRSGRGRRVPVSQGRSSSRLTSSVDLWYTCLHLEPVTTPTPLQEYPSDMSVVHRPFTGAGSRHSPDTRRRQSLLSVRFETGYRVRLVAVPVPTPDVFLVWGSGVGRGVLARHVGPVVLGSCASQFVSLSRLSVEVPRCLYKGSVPYYLRISHGVSGGQGRRGRDPEGEDTGLGEEGWYQRNGGTFVMQDRWTGGTLGQV